VFRDQALAEHHGVS
jgi:hypothetical protein